LQVEFGAESLATPVTRGMWEDVKVNLAKVERKVELIKLEEAQESTRVEIRELEKPGIFIFIIKESDE